MSVKFKAQHVDSNDVVQPDGWWIDGEVGELAEGTKRGPYEKRIDARKALETGRRPYAVLIARADALATDLGKTPPAPRCYQQGERDLTTCIRAQETRPPQGFGAMNPDRMCGACAAYWHATMAATCLRRVQAVEEAIAAESAREQQACEVADRLSDRHRVGRPDGIQHADDEPSEAEAELRRMGEAR